MILIWKINRNSQAIGSFSNKIRNENKIVIGEKAGFQDLLWGFGIRNAIKSGFIAANNILEGNDYENIIKLLKNILDQKLMQE